MPRSANTPTISDIIAEVSRSPLLSDNAEFSASGIPWAACHRAGISTTGSPVILLASEDVDARGRPPDLVLENIRVRYSASCTVAQPGGLPDHQCLTIVECLSDQVTLRQLFGDLMQDVVNEIGPHKVTDQRIAGLIGGLVELFRRLSQPGRRALLGLWGELVAIELLGASHEIIGSWRNDARDRFDFLRGHNALEVKTTQGPNRTHRFGLEQVRTSPDITCVVASLIAREDASGMSVIELARHLASNIDASSIQRSFWRKVFDVGGNGLEGDDDLRFDLASALRVCAS